MDQRLAEIGLTTQQAAVLSVVEAAPVPPTLGQVAGVLGSSHQNARQIVSALERKGRLTVEVDPDDRRARRLRVTQHVGAVFAGRDQADQSAVGQWLGVLSEDEQRQAVQLLNRLLADLME
jgi:DNA-binding MarR family transcriptional regulator